MTKTKNSNRLEKAKSVVKKINSDLIDASFNAIENSVKAGEKWQKLTVKLIKKSEPLTKKQMGMFVETADNIKQQAEFGLTRLKKLVGYDDTMLEDAKKKVIGNPLVKKAEKMIQKFQKEVSENPLVKKADKISDKIKKEANETIEELKAKATKISEDVKDKLEDFTDEANEKVDAYVSGKEKAPKKKTKKEVAKKTVVSDKKDDLKVIKGIGPKMEQILNDNNINSYAVLAKTTVEDLNKILTKSGVNVNRYNTSDWTAAAIIIVKQ